VSVIVGLVAGCDRELIHLPGSIQPFGALIVLDARQIVVQISANSEQWLRITPASALGRPFADVLGEDFAQRITQALASGAHGRGNIQPGPPGLDLGVSVHSLDDLDYIEFEAMAAQVIRAALQQGELDGHAERPGEHRHVPAEQLVL